MEAYTPLLQEFIARKEQVLNLEVRLFVITIFMQIIFVYVYYQSNKKCHKYFIAVLSLPFFFLLFEAIAINGKMGLISTYLQQLEGYMTNSGFIGLVWESKALEKIIFPIGNAFTLPAALAMMMIIVEIYLMSMLFAMSVFEKSIKARATGLLIWVIIIFIIIKSLTVDFHNQIPNVFE